MAKYGRHRTRVLEEPQYEDQIKSGNWFSPPYVNATHLMSSDDDSMFDTVSPNFSKRIRAGEIIFHPCLYERNTKSHNGVSHYKATNNSTGNWSALDGGNLSQAIADAYGYSGLSHPGTTDVARRAKLSAISNLDATPYAFGEDAFEIRETLRFLRRPFSSMAKLAKSFQRSVRRGETSGLNRAKAIANAWTEYRFAFSPLVRSAQDVAEVLTRLKPTLPPRLTARGFAQFDTSSEVTKRHVDTFSFDLIRTMDYDVDYHASILYTVTNPCRDLRFTLGLRAKDLPTTVWQVMPYSFMIDRLVDISSSIMAVTNLLDPNVKILSGSLRKKENFRRDVSVANGAQPGYTIELSGDVSEHKTFTYDREIWYPSVSDVIPPITPGRLVKDAQSIADLGSLILQRIK